MTNLSKYTALSLTLIASLFWIGTSHAVDYDVEIIIFEHATTTGVGRSDTMLLPAISGARSIPDQPEAASPIQPLPQLRLTDEADKINQSDNHRLVYHGGWRQTDFDQESAPFMQIALGQQVAMHAEQAAEEADYLRGHTSPINTRNSTQQVRSATIFGGIKVWVGRFLHFETLLSYTPRGGESSYAMKTERRMRSRQLHYIDNPRMGIITKIFPVDETAPN